MEMGLETVTSGKVVAVQEKDRKQSGKLKSANIATIHEKTQRDSATYTKDLTK